MLLVATDANHPPFTLVQMKTKKTLIVGFVRFGRYLSWPSSVLGVNSIFPSDIWGNFIRWRDGGNRLRFTCTVNSLNSWHAIGCTFSNSQLCRTSGYRIRLKGEDCSNSETVAIDLQYDSYIRNAVVLWLIHVFKQDYSFALIKMQILFCILVLRTI